MIGKSQKSVKFPHTEKFFLYYKDTVYSCQESDGSEESIPHNLEHHAGYIAVIMDLYILRHGKAGKGFSDPIRDDARRLTQKGTTEMKVIARWLKRTGITWDVIATSPLRRAQETAGIIAGEHDPGPPIEVWDALSTGGSSQELRRHLGAYKEFSSVLIVGHEPFLSDLTGNLVSGSSHVSIALSKGSIAKVRDLRTEESFSGVLEWLIPASVMICQ